MDPRRKRGGKRERSYEYEEMSEEELALVLRRCSWSWLAGLRRAPDPVEIAPPEPPEPPPSEAPGKRRRQKREAATASPAFRKAAWAWLSPPPPKEPKAPPPRRPRAKKEALPEGALALRKAAWAWLSPASAQEPKAPPQRRPRARKEALPEGALALRKAAWEWLSPPPPAPEPKQTKPPPQRRVRARKEALPEGALALRKASWAWLGRSPAPAPAPAVAPPVPAPEPPGKRRRPKREVTPEAVIELRRRAWAWFAPRATGEAAAGTHAPARAPAPVEAVPGGEVVRSHLKGVLEALIFASEHPLPARELARLARADLKVVKSILAELVEEYLRRGFRLDEVAGGFVFRTSPLFAPFVREQVAKKPVKMSRAQIETLAIVAYRQPITRPEIDEVRGVDSGAVLKSLLERELVRILGKKDEPGRPMLYGTTGSFLEFFGLKALGDLPTLREFTELTDESRRTYEREMGEDPPEAGAPGPSEGLMGGEGDFRRAAAEDKPPPRPEDFEDPEPVEPAVESDGVDPEASTNDAGSAPADADGQGSLADIDSPDADSPDTDSHDTDSPDADSPDTDSPDADPEEEDDEDEDDDEDDEDWDEDEDDEDEDDDEDDEDEDDEDEDEDDDE